MCLTKITSITREEVEGEGWKVIVHNEWNNTFNGTHFGINNDYNTWLTNADSPGIYRNLCGFHIFEDEEGALSWLCTADKRETIVKVKYRNIIVRGIQDGYNVIVTEEMYVEKLS